LAQKGRQITLVDFELERMLLGYVFRCDVHGHRNLTQTLHLQFNAQIGLHAVKNGCADKGLMHLHCLITPLKKLRQVHARAGQPDISAGRAAVSCHINPVPIPIIRLIGKLPPAYPKLETGQFDLGRPQIFGLALPSSGHAATGFGARTPSMWQIATIKSARFSV
jgi:hypothetical protein